MIMQGNTYTSCTVIETRKIPIVVWTCPSCHVMQNEGEIIHVEYLLQLLHHTKFKWWMILTPSLSRWKSLDHCAIGNDHASKYLKLMHSDKNRYLTNSCVNIPILSCHAEGRWNITCKVSSTTLTSCKNNLTCQHP